VRARWKVLSEKDCFKPKINTNFATNDFLKMFTHPIWSKVHKPPTGRKFQNQERM
jgi:hypothetical protein